MVDGLVGLMVLFEEIEAIGVESIPIDSVRFIFRVEIGGIEAGEETRVDLVHFFLEKVTEEENPLAPTLVPAPRRPAHAPGLRVLGLIEEARSPKMLSLLPDEVVRLVGNRESNRIGSDVETEIEFLSLFHAFSPLLY